MDLAAIAPDPWPYERAYQSNSELTLADDFLSEDFCVLGGKHFFVRSVLRFPVRGLDWSFGFGCWGTLSRPNFETYIEHFDEGSYAGLGPWPSWLCNQLLPFMEGITSPLGCDMVPQLNRQRPELYVAQGCDVLIEAQEEGLTAVQVLDIFACYGHPWCRE